MKFDDYYFTEDNKEMFLNCVREELNNLLLTEQEANSIEIPQEFISKLLTHLEQRFPSYGQFDQQIGNEIRKYMKQDNSYVKAVKKRILDIINKSKVRFLTTVADRVQKIKVQPKSGPKVSPLYISDPLQADEPIVGDVPSYVNQ